MKTIKFRIWSGEEKRFYYTDLYYEKFRSFYEFFEMLPGYSEISKMNNDEPHSIQQFTGLQDQDRKDIYEGDIVDFNGKKVIIEWNEAEGAFWGGTNKQRFILQYADMLKIIGNKMENKELLKEMGVI